MKRKENVEIKKLTVLIEVWLASISPDTRWDVVTYGDFRDKATWMEAGPHGMNWASFRSRIRWRLLWIWVGSTSPYIDTNLCIKKKSIKIQINDLGTWMMFKMDV